MGSAFVTYAKAAERLGCSLRSIHNYIGRGFLKPVRNGKSVVLHEDDVEQLAQDKGVDLPVLSRQNMFELQMRLRKLEQDMTVVRRMLDIKEDPLRYDDPAQYAVIHEHAHFLRQHPEAMDRGMILSWCNLLDRMDELTLRQLAAAIPTPEPWAVFFNLILDMMEKTSKSTDLEDRLLHKRLDESRKKIRGTILMWMELGEKATPRASTASLDSPKDELVRRLAKKNGNSL